MSKKNSFIMMKEWKDQIEYLGTEQKADLLDLIFAYQTGEDIRNTGDQAVAVVFSFMKRVFDENDQKYEETCRKRTEAAKASKSKQKEAIASKSTQNAPDTEHDTDTDTEHDTDTDSEYDTDTEHDTENEPESDSEKEKGPKGPKKKKFVPPDVCEVEAYITDKGYSVSASAFIDYYTANGWMVGRNRMKDWKAAVRTWNSRNSNAPPGKVRSGKSFSEIADELAGGGLF